MIFSYIFTENALFDIIKVALWEDEKHEGLGSKLMVRIDETAEDICKLPKAYRIRYKQTRERKVKKFLMCLFTL